MKAQGHTLHVPALALGVNHGTCSRDLCLPAWSTSESRPSESLSLPTRCQDCVCCPAEGVEEHSGDPCVPFKGSYGARSRPGVPASAGHLSRSTRTDANRFGPVGGLIAKPWNGGEGCLSAGARVPQAEMGAVTQLMTSGGFFWFPRITVRELGMRACMSLCVCL